MIKLKFNLKGVICGRVWVRISNNKPYNQIVYWWWTCIYLIKTQISFINITNILNKLIN